MRGGLTLFQDLSLTFLRKLLQILFQGHWIISGNSLSSIDLNQSSEIATGRARFLLEWYLSMFRRSWIVPGRISLFCPGQLCITSISEPCSTSGVWSRICLSVGAELGLRKAEVPQGCSLCIAKYPLQFCPEDFAWYREETPKMILNSSTKMLDLPTNFDASLLGSFPAFPEQNKRRKKGEFTK